MSLRAKVGAAETALTIGTTISINDIGFLMSARGVFEMQTSHLYLLCS